MAHLKDLIVNGSSRFLGRIYAPAGMEGTATKAEALTTNAGSSTLPVFFENGVPKAITSYSGKATSAGTADVATKLGTASVGSTSEPIYLNAGVPTKISYKIEKSVPSNAVFTDTTYSAGTGLSLSGTTFNHSNSITAITTAAFKKFKYDAQGHITGTSDVAASDLPDHTHNYVPNTQAGVNAALNLLSTGSSTPNDDDYYISQYAGGGTTTTTYHRRPVSKLWDLFKTKISATNSGSGSVVVGVTQSNGAFTVTLGEPQVTVTNPASQTDYGMIFAANANTTEANVLRKNNNFRFRNLLGTATAEGKANIILGNNVAKGTANNETGRITLYADTTHWVDLVPVSGMNADRTINITNASGNMMVQKKQDSFWGIIDGDGSDTSWIRTPKSGIIPYGPDNSATNGNATNIGSATWHFKDAYVNNYAAKVVTSTTLGTVTGSSFLKGDNLIGGTADWVGIQAHGSNDRFQMFGWSNRILFRQNDNSDSAVTDDNWSKWVSFMTSDDISGSGGITVTPGTDTIGTGDAAVSVPRGVTISHSNSITAVTTAGFYKLKYDAQGHVTGTTAVAKADITALGIPGSNTNTTYTFATGTTQGAFSVTPSGGTAQSVKIYDLGQVYTTATNHSATDDKDWNLFTTNGWHMAANAANSPDSSIAWWIAIVSRHNEKYITQDAWSFTDTANNIAKHYVRRMVNSTWGQWNEVKYTDTTYGAEKGISLTSGKFGHSNTAITALSTAGLKKVAYDAYGHITSTSDVTKSDITALGIPGSDTNTDTKVNVTLNTTTKAYLLGTTTTPTATATAVTSVADTGVYLDTTAGSLTATKFYASGTDGYTGKDSTNTKFTLVGHNNSNLWIGAAGSTAYHHKGSTFISTGWDGTLPTSEGVLTGKSTAYISVPKYTVAAGATTGTWSHTSYDIIHSGNYTSYVTPANIGAATSGHTHSTYVLKAGDTMTGSLTLGTPNQAEIPTVGITVQDIRNATNGANSGVQKGVNFYFTNAGSPSTGWWSIMHVRGWTSTYSAWELAGPSHNSDNRTTPIYVRGTNAGTAWGAWRKIYDASNPPTAAEVGASPTGHTHDYIPLAGSSAVTGAIKMSTTDAQRAFAATDTSTTTTIWMGVGSGHVNHGMYSDKIGAWLIYADDSTHLSIHSKQWKPATDGDWSGYLAMPLFANAVGDGGKKLVNNDGIRYEVRTGTTSAEGAGRLVLGNATASGTDGNKTGSLRMFSSSTYYGTISPTSLTANRSYTLPNKDGTVALTSDIQTYTGGTGISIGTGNVINHSNSITAATTAVFKKFTYDAQGHITGSAAVAAGDLPSHTHSYLPLSGGTVTGAITLKSSTYDGSLANNGVSSGIGYPTLFNIIDKNDKVLVRTEGTINTNGNIGWNAYVRNYNTSGTQVAQKGLSFTMDKSGNLTWSVSDAAAFRTAIGNPERKVRQSVTTTTNYRPLLSGANNLATRTGLTTTVDGESYISDNFFVQPSTGSLYATNLIAHSEGTGTVCLSLFRNGGRSFHIENASGAMYIKTNYAYNSTSGGWDKTSDGSYSTEIYRSEVRTNKSTPYTVFSSTIEANQTIVAKNQNGIRLQYGNYGFIMRNDGGTTYFLLTDSGNQETNTWNSLRPFAINNSTGAVQMNNGLFLNGCKLTMNRNSRTNEPINIPMNTTDITTYGDSNGSLMVMGFGGCTVLAAGEVGQGIIDEIKNSDDHKFLLQADRTTKYTGGSELAIIASDTLIVFTVNGNTYANRKSAVISSALAFYPISKDTGSIGHADYHWGSGYINDLNVTNVSSTGKDSSWVGGMDNAVVRMTTADNKYRPILAFHTETGGFWGLGNHTGDNLLFTFVTAANYSSKTNTATSQIGISNDNRVFIGGANSRQTSLYGDGLRLRTSSANDWTMGMSVVKNSDSSDLGSMGFYGGANSLSYAYIGPASNNYRFQVDLSNTNGIVRVRGTQPGIRFIQTTDGKAYDNAWCGINVFAANTTGTNMVMQSGGNVIIGSGESGNTFYNLETKATFDYWNEGGETTYLLSDSHIVLASNCNTIANRKRFVFTNSGNFYVENTQSMGFLDQSGSNYHGQIKCDTLTAARTYTFPDRAGTIEIYKQSHMVDENSDFASYAWHKVASTTLSTNYLDRTITFMVSKSWGQVPTNEGILTAHIRTEGNKNCGGTVQFKWLVAGTDIAPANFVLLYKNTENTKCDVEIWYKQTARYDGWVFKVMNAFTRVEDDLKSWTIYNTQGHGSASYTSGYTVVPSTTITPASAVNDVQVTPSENKDIVRPLLFAASNANPTNTYQSSESISTETRSTSNSYVGPINMTGGAFIRTNQWTTQGTAGKTYTTIYAGGFVATEANGGFIGTATSAINDDAGNKISETYGKKMDRLFTSSTTTLSQMSQSITINNVNLSAYDFLKLVIKSDSNNGETYNVEEIPAITGLHQVPLIGNGGSGPTNPSVAAGSVQVEFSAGNLTLRIYTSRQYSISTSVTQLSTAKIFRIYKVYGIKI